MSSISASVTAVCSITINSVTTVTTFTTFTTFAAFAAFATFATVSTSWPSLFLLLQTSKQGPFLTCEDEKSSLILWRLEMESGIRLTIWCYHGCLMIVTSGITAHKKPYRETASKQTSEDRPFQFSAGSCSAHPAKHRHFRCSTDAARLYNGAAPGQQMHRNSQASPQIQSQLGTTSHKRFSTSNERKSTDQTCCVSSETYCMLPVSDYGIAMWIGLHVHKFLSGVPQEVSEDAMRRHDKESEVWRLNIHKVQSIRALCTASQAKWEDCSTSILR